MANPQGGTLRVATASQSGGSNVLLYVGLSALLVLTLIGLDALLLVLNKPSLSKHHYFVALGDSITFGFQPNTIIFDHDYADDLFADLQATGVTDEENLACGGESTTTMIKGGCPFKLLRHFQYFGPQLDAAVSLLRAHPGQVSPVTLDIGANDVLPDFDSSRCTVSASADAHLTTMDTNLTQTILPRLLRAVTVRAGQRAADLVLLNYYNPFAKKCPDSAPFIHTFNDHLVADAAEFRIPVVDVYAAFGGDAQMANNLCTLTWVCDASHPDIHPTNKGYQVIADAVEQLLGYPTGGIPNPVPNFPVPAAPPPATETPEGATG